jgi:hypothetical protein
MEAAWDMDVMDMNRTSEGRIDETDLDGVAKYVSTRTGNNGVNDELSDRDNEEIDPVVDGVLSVLVIPDCVGA